MKMPWLQSWCLILLIAVLPAVAQDRQVFGFKAPDSIDAPAMPTVMRDLAERVLPVPHDHDSDRYLATLSALPWADNNYKAAEEPRRTLRDRRPPTHRPNPHATPHLLLTVTTTAQTT